MTGLGVPPWIGNHQIKPLTMAIRNLASQSDQERSCSCSWWAAVRAGWAGFGRLGNCFRPGVFGILLVHSKRITVGHGLKCCHKFKSKLLYSEKVTWDAVTHVYVAKLFQHGKNQNWQEGRYADLDQVAFLLIYIFKMRTYHNVGKSKPSPISP